MASEVNTRSSDLDASVEGDGKGGCVVLLMDLSAECSENSSIDLEGRRFKI